MEVLARWSTNCLLRCHAIDKEDRDVYEYGFGMLYGCVIDVLSILVISLLIGHMPETLIYHAAFVPLRQIAGGLHASTRLRCFVISTAIWLASLWMISSTAMMSWVSVALVIASGAAIWVYAPVAHENNPMSEGKRLRMRLMGRVAVTVGALAMVGCVLIGWDVVLASIAWGMASAAGMMLAAKMTHRFI